MNPAATLKSSVESARTYAICSTPAEETLHAFPAYARCGCAGAESQGLVVDQANGRLSEFQGAHDISIPERAGLQGRKNSASVERKERRRLLYCVGKS